MTVLVYLIIKADDFIYDIIYRVLDFIVGDNKAGIFILAFTLLFAVVSIACIVK